MKSVDMKALIFCMSERLFRKVLLGVFVLIISSKVNFNKQRTKRSKVKFASFSYEMIFRLKFYIKTTNSALFEVLCNFKKSMIMWKRC